MKVYEFSEIAVS